MNYFGGEVTSQHRNFIENHFFKVLSQEMKDLCINGTIDTIDAKYSNIQPLEFHQKYVSKNLPLLIRNGASHWSAVNKWSINHFRKNIPDKNVTVAVTPNGYADAIVFDDKTEREYFVMPEERTMKMSMFLDYLEKPEKDQIVYIQQQNSNFQNVFYEFKNDVQELKWATEAFAKSPDAINFWMGEERAITSMHKDPYENIYCVVTGEKKFILHPPTDLPWIPYGKYPPAIYKRETSSWLIQPFHENDESTESNNDKLRPWISIDPLEPNYSKYPKYKNATTVQVSLGPGDVLYLPSLWFHHVQQSHACIAINYWYDMDYDIKYAYYQALESLIRQM